MRRASPTVTPLSVPPPLLARYGGNGPRYTSYPTAAVFDSHPDLALLTELWRAANPARALSVYVHIPFCSARCLYCACTTETGHSPESMADYAELLPRELDRLLGLAGSEREARQLALGGGTPTALAPSLLRRLVESLDERLHFVEGHERSIELDPRHVDRDYLDLLIELGFNRFSFGVQEFDGEVQRRVGRIVPELQVSELVEHLRRRGRSAINVDIMYGLPGQSEGSFARTLGTLVAMRPSRVAVFGYAHVPWVSPHQKSLERYDLPGKELRTRLFGMAYERLVESGYLAIGLDHFALPDDELAIALESGTLNRNFMGYTSQRGLDLMGVGASAISAMGASYTQNVRSVAEYHELAGQLAWSRGLALSPEDLLRREVILELSCNCRLDLRGFGLRFGIDAEEHFRAELGALEGFRDDGLLTLEQGRVEVTPLGRLFIRAICMTFDQYLGKTQGRYSSTV